MDDTALLAFTMLAVLVLASAAAAAGETDVSVRPGIINSQQCSSVTGEISISAGNPGTFLVSIEGVPEDWLDYENRVHVDDEKTVTYVVDPQAPGTYYLTVTVDGPAGFYSEDRVKLWVSKRGTAELQAAGEEGSGIEGGLAGMFAFGEQEQLVLLVTAVVIAVLFVLFLARSVLKEEEPGDGMGLNF
jgi:hypothetical protein